MVTRKENKNMKSSIMKNISYAVLIIGILGSFLSGEIFKTFDFDEQEFVYNTQLAIVGVIMILLLFFIMFALSALMEEVEVLRENQKVMLNRIKKSIEPSRTKSNKSKLSQEIKNKNIKSVTTGNLKNEQQLQRNNEDVDGNQTNDLWGKPNEISKVIYDATLSVLDNMDEYIDGVMPMIDFLKNVQDECKIVKDYCNSDSTKVSNDEYMIEVALVDIAAMQDITMDEIEEYKVKLLKLLNFEE